MADAVKSAIASKTDLTGANLTGANLTGANLTGANLTGADLTGANLTGANPYEAKNSALAIAQTRILPPEGNIVAWKKAATGEIIKLLIPTDAKRSHAFGRKCRASHARVLDIFYLNKSVPGPVTSNYNPDFTYSPGSIVYCDTWCDDFTQECAGGIHFFITREEAEAYQF
jgi:hypothetical protein